MTGHSPLDNLDVKVFTERICDLRGNLQICGWRRDVRTSQRNWDEYREAAEMVLCGAGVVITLNMRFTPREKFWAWIMGT